MTQEYNLIILDVSLHENICTFAVGENGNVDDLMPGTLREALAVVQEAYDKWDLLGSNFPNDLVKRGLADEKRLPHFPFRDDGRVIWDIIEKWVQAYVKGFYKSDEEVAIDVELQVCCLMHAWHA